MSLESSSSDFVEILFRHKWKILILPPIILALTAGIVLFFPRTYRSEAKLFLQVGHESLGIDPSATTGATISLMQSDRNEEVKSAIQVIGSRGTIGMVVDRLGADYVLNAGDSDSVNKPNRVTEFIKSTVSQAIGLIKQIDPVSRREEAIIEIEKNLRVEAERNTTVLAAKLDSESAVAAQKILSTLVDIYQAEHLRIHRNPDSGNFLADQRDLLLEKLNRAQAALTEAKNRVGVSSIEGRRTALEAQLQAIELELIHTRQELATTEARTKELDVKLTSIPARETSSNKSIPNVGADLMQEELYSNQVKLMEYKAKFAPGHPLLVTTERKLEQAKKIVEEQVKERHETVDDINPIHRELTLDLKRQQGIYAGWAARQTELERQLKTTSEAIERFNSDEYELDSLRRNEQIANNKFLEYTNSFEQARMDEAREKGQISSVSVAQQATLSEKPVSPSKVLVILGGLFMTFASVVALIFLSEKLNNRLRNESELTSLLGLPVLASITESQLNKRILCR